MSSLLTCSLAHSVAVEHALCHLTSECMKVVCAATGTGRELAPCCWVAWSVTAGGPGAEGGSPGTLAGCLAALSLLREGC